MLGALGACALIIILAMAIIVGGRTRELGVLKAIGATDRQVIVQFAVEVVCICLVSIVLATGVTAIVGQKLGDWLMSGNDTAQAQTETQVATNGTQGGPGGMMVGGPPGMAGDGGSLYITADTSNTDTDLNVVYRGGLFLYGILILFFLSLLGMAVPVVWITRLRPARVLSME